ncbi:MAG: FG-GAP-like repeat-containing protein [Bacteroidales bacterium]
MNGDGFMDLAAFGNGLFTLWLGNGNGTWTQETSFTVPQPGNCQAFTVGGDIDHNGFPDLLLVSEEGSWPNYQNHLRCYKENSAPQNLTVFPAFPKGLEKFQAQSVQFIDWLSGIPENEASLIKIQYALNGNNGPWHLIADSLPNSGRIQWIVPQAESTDCYIQITVYTASDQAVATTPQPFTITAGNGIYADFVADTTQGNCPLTVQFTNLSSPNATCWEWDFECDGLIDSYEKNPLFTYASPGLFSVKLTVSDGNTTNSRIRENYITINDWTGISSMKKNSTLQFFPNPLKGAGTLVFSLHEAASAAVVSLYNFSGIQVWQQQTRFFHTGKNSLMIDFRDSGIPSGIYYLTLQSGKTSGRIKVIVQ